MPVMAPGVGGNVCVMINTLATLNPQEEDACTVIVEGDTKLLSNVTVMTVSIAPGPLGCAVMVTPAGTVQT